MVEAAGVEPASESDPPRASTCLAPSEVLSPLSPKRAEDSAASPLHLVFPQRAVGEDQPVTRRPQGLPPAGPTSGRHRYLSGESKLTVVSCVFQPFLRG